ncbi:MAG: carboxypeptidase M32 [Alphaproteobacteria bacterium]|nr:carboxypeptidase M32 [Alphaproteobacteria bacterium]
MPNYRELESRFRRIAVLEGAEAVLHWDAATMMPKGGAQVRAEQIAGLKGLRHELLNHPALADLLSAAEAERAALDPWQRANLREMRRRWRHATALPADLVEASSKAASACEMAWREARPANDFAGLAPRLAEVVRLARERAAAKAAALDLSAYDALLDQYEPGLRQTAVDAVFGELMAFLPDLLGQAIARQRSLPAPLPLPGPFPLAIQRKLAERLMAALGFDFEYGRLDVSHHPFTGGVPDDVRLTTRYAEADFAGALMGTLHETGHALYERGLPVRWRHQPVGEAMGMAMHESQSLIVEMQACRSDAFIGFLAPLLAESFGGAAQAWAPANLARHYRRVARSPIRVDADEVSYPLHIVLRYRLERRLIDGSLTVAELPGAWADLMRELVGVVPPDDRDGCLQDIHWMGGDLGYFPTYTLGAIAAAQLFAAAQAAVPGLAAALARGDFRPLVGWLAQNVHVQGSLHESADALLVAVTGRPLDVAAFRGHLVERYLA